MITAALDEGWGLNVASLRYLPLGFGSHHWEVTSTDGTRWFATADELPARRMSRAEPLDAVFGRLSASLAIAVTLSDLGRSFVVAPVPDVAGQPVRRLADRFSVSLYPYVDGQSFHWGDFATPGQRRAVLDMIISIHTAPAAVGAAAMIDDLSIFCRDELSAALDGVPGTPDSGPYGQPAAELVAAHENQIRQSLARYDGLARRIRLSAEPMVLTHGEPHPGNTMLSARGWLLIDWDTALRSAPERDLCLLDPGDGSTLAVYQQATGTAPRPYALEFFKLRWDLTDIALAVGQFRAPHSGAANESKSFNGLRTMLAGIPR
jgi:hypothetical protein